MWRWINSQLFLFVYFPDYSVNISSGIDIWYRKYFNKVSLEIGFGNLDPLAILWKENRKNQLWTADGTKTCFI